MIDTILAACTKGDLDRVTRILDEDPALANARSMLGVGPVHAAWFAGHTDMVALLESRGVTRDIFLAAELGAIDFVQRALSSDRSLATAFNEAGSTALHCACYWGQTAVARLLLKHDADPNAVTRDGFLQIMPLGCAVATPDIQNPSQNEEVVVELVDLLIASGADVNGRRRDGLTALHSAAFRGHLRVIALLLGNGADRTIQGSAGHHAGQTALDMAIAQNQPEAAVLLAKSPARPSV